MPEHTPQAAEYQVFLSYAREDKERAISIAAALGRQGWSVFIDQEIPNAERWEQYLRQQLETVSCVLALWSSSAKSSEWVRREAQRGAERKALVHATLDETQPPGDFADFQASDLADWRGGSDEPAFLRLLSAVAMKIGGMGAVGTLPEPRRFDTITEDHLALASTSWRRSGAEGQRPFPFQIHLRLLGTNAALRRVENVLYYFDPVYAENRPDLVNPTLKAYVKVSVDLSRAFGVYELANGYSIVRASVKVRNQARIVKLSRIVDIMEKGPVLKLLYPYG